MTNLSPVGMETISSFTSITKKDPPPKKKKLFQDDRSQDLPDTWRISVSSGENNMEVPLRIPQHACCCSLIIKCVICRARQSEICEGMTAQRLQELGLILTALKLCTYK